MSGATPGSPAPAGSLLFTVADLAKGAQSGDLAASAKRVAEDALQAGDSELKDGAPGKKQG